MLTTKDFQLQPRDKPSAGTTKTVIGCSLGFAAVVLVVGFILIYRAYMEKEKKPDKTQETAQEGREPSIDEKMDDNRRHGNDPSVSPEAQQHTSYDTSSTAGRLGTRVNLVDQYQPMNAPSIYQGRGPAFTAGSGRNLHINHDGRRPASANASTLISSLGNNSTYDEQDRGFVPMGDNRRPQFSRSNSKSDISSITGGRVLNERVSYGLSDDSIDSEELEDRSRGSGVHGGRPESRIHSSEEVRMDEGAWMNGQQKAPMQNDGP
ncbi:MAG: hypothetical protein Q9167_002127 [Letrouitia subvulpina]